MCACVCEYVCVLPVLLQLLLLLQVIMYVGSPVRVGGGSPFVCVCV